MYKAMYPFDPEAAPLFSVHVLPDLFKYHIITEEEFRAKHPLGASSDVHIAYCKRVGWFKQDSPYMRLTEWLCECRSFLPKSD